MLKEESIQKISPIIRRRIKVMPAIISCYPSNKLVSSSIVLLLAVFFFFMPVAMAADTSGKNSDSIQVMETFERQNLGGEEAVSDHKKHLIMFMIGVPLLLLIIITGALGIAMVVFGKPVFVMHMIFAGLSITLMIVHAIVGLVWFNPF